MNDYQIYIDEAAAHDIALACLPTQPQHLRFRTCGSLGKHEELQYAGKLVVPYVYTFDTIAFP